MVAKIKITVEGLEETITMLGDIGTILTQGTSKRLERGGKTIIERTSWYPPEMPNQRYVWTNIYGTTFTLKKLSVWNIEMTSDARQGGRGYSHWVGGGEEGLQQAGIHVGRWRLFRQETDKEVEKIAKDIDKMVQARANKTK